VYEFVGESGCVSRESVSGFRLGALTPARAPVCMYMCLYVYLCV